jgi:predicted MFS family arabinose efflux permease
VLLSVWALASAIGGLTYGARSWRLPLDAVYLRLAALLPLGFLPALAAPSVAVMALLILPAGLLIAPLGAAGNQLVGRVAPAGAVTEAYTWPVTAMTAGFAIGIAVGGSLVEAVDWRACFAAAAIAGALAAVIAYSQRATLATAPQPV